MSKIYFLADPEKTTETTSSRSSVSHSLQSWRNVIQRILNNEFQSVQFDSNSNVFQRRLLDEYTVKENERIYQIQAPRNLYLPSEEVSHARFVQDKSLLFYSASNPQTAEQIIVPSLADWDTLMKISVIEDQTEREPSKFSTQKRVTSKRRFFDVVIIDRFLVVSPNRSMVRSSLLEDIPPSIFSPKWRTSLDERRPSSVDSRPRSSLASYARPSEDLRQIIMQAIRTNSYPDGNKRQANSLIDLHHENHAGRLSQRSISYGFGLGTKTWPSITERTKSQSETITTTPTYRLPSNKIDLDLTQQDLIRRTGSFKRKSDIMQ